MEKWSCRNPLSIEERKSIENGIRLGRSSREIGKEINRNKSIILRESKRLGNSDEYNAEKAQENFEYKQREGWRKSRETKKTKQFCKR